MIVKTKKYLNLVCFYIILFISSIFTSEVKAETKIIAKRGDTLVKISREYGVTLKELMYKNDFYDATKIIEGEIIIIPTKTNAQDKINEHKTYKVIEGDTLYKISIDYNIKLEDIIRLNSLRDESSLRVNQILLLPKGAKKKKKNISNSSIQQVKKKVAFHLTSKTEELSTIAKLHRISIEEINTFNKFTDPTKINPNIKLRLRKNKVSKWRKYGSIMVNWSDWTYFGGNYISKAKTKKDTSFYIAINCTKRTLNNTLNNPSWKNWYFPKTDFEFKLINDFCDKEFNF